VEMAHKCTNLNSTDPKIPVKQYTKNYKCDCESGWDEIFNKTVRTCKNHDDRPKNVCNGFGTGHDLINSYTCVCFTELGYRKTTTVAEGNETCAPAIWMVYPVENAGLKIRNKTEWPANTKKVFAEAAPMGFLQEAVDERDASFLQV